MRESLAGSLNITAVKTLYLAGIENVLDAAENFGYSTLSDRSRFGLSLVLGGGEVTLLEHTSAFATFAREGIYHPVVSILKIEDNKGKVLEEYEEREDQVFDTESVRTLNRILADDAARAYVFRAGSILTLPGRPVATKTGTTNNYRDAWTIGYTPSIATGVWVGNNDNSEMRRGAAGSVVAAPIWHNYMKQAVTGPVESFRTVPANKTSKDVLRGNIEGEAPLKVDSVTGKLIPEECIDTYPKLFIEEKIFRVVHNILHYIDRSDPNGPIPSDPTIDPQYERWEEPVKRWAEKNNYLEIKPEKESCTLRSLTNQPSITITSPEKGDTINSKTITLTVNASTPTSNSLEKVEYYLDDELIGTSTTSPFTLTYNIEDNILENGFHDLQAIVYDTLENFSSDEVIFNYLIGQSNTNAS